MAANAPGNVVRDLMALILSRVRYHPAARSPGGLARAGIAHCQPTVQFADRPITSHQQAVKMCAAGPDGLD
jgi:hypothetical protein